jgi:hypothetical protein
LVGALLGRIQQEQPVGAKNLCELEVVLVRCGQSLLPPNPVYLGAFQKLERWRFGKFDREEILIGEISDLPNSKLTARSIKTTKSRGGEAGVGFSARAKARIISAARSSR